MMKQIDTNQSHPDEKRPLLSLITPTRNRQHLLPTLQATLQRQSYNHFEWLILDDSPLRATAFLSFADPRVKYTHLRQTVTLGEKRNMLIAASSGTIIVHIDDDDYYAPPYLDKITASIRAGTTDLEKLSGFFILDLRFDALFYWQQDLFSEIQFVCHPRQQFTTRVPNDSQKVHAVAHLLGFGFSYAYSRSVWHSSPFEHVDFAEDLTFIRQARNSHRLGLRRDTEAICLHVIHEGSSSGCFPQYRIPLFMLTKLFPDYAGMRR